jgi:3-polyprenyl-4-hydroxybenzoate decarboxylase
MGQMMFTKYIVVVDDDVEVHNTSEVLFRLCANSDPQRDSIFTEGPAEVLDHANSEITSGSKLGIDATKKTAGRRLQTPLATTDSDGRSGAEKKSVHCLGDRKGERKPKGRGHSKKTFPACPALPGLPAAPALPGPPSDALRVTSQFTFPKPPFAPIPPAPAAPPVPPSAVMAIISRTISSKV